MKEVSSRNIIVAALKACAKQKDLDKGSRIHADMNRMGFLEEDVFVGSALVSMYAKCGSLAKAEEVFDSLPVRTVISWNALIAAYAQDGHGEKAMHCFERMKLEGLSPDAVTFVCMLKACGSTGASDRGQELHAEIVRQGLLQKHVVIGNALVDMYARCGLLTKAQEVLDSLSTRNAISWSALITGYCQYGHGKEAVNCFERMQDEGILPDAVTFVCALKACGSIRAADKGQEIHAAIVREGLLTRHIGVGTALVDMYGKCGLLAKAQEVFNNLPVRNVVSWSALIAGCAQHGHCEQASNFFEQMKLEGILPDPVTFVCLLKACESKTTFWSQEIHVQIVEEGLLGMHIAIGTTLMDMYAKCGLLAKAQRVFDKLPMRNVVSWSVLILAYAQHEYGEEALKCYERMDFEGLTPDAFTFVCILKACGSIGDVNKGQKVHDAVVREGLLDNDVFVGTALVDMYGKCGLLLKAQEVFDKLAVRDVCLWNALIGCYAQHGHSEEALNCFLQMQLDGFPPDAITYACVLKACGNLGAIDQGVKLHADIVKYGLLEEHAVVGNALIDMYARCGALMKAQEVFDKLPDRDVVTWSALILGYAEHGYSEKALHCYEEMQMKGVFPNSVTFICILKACGITGAINKGQELHVEIVIKKVLEKDVFVGNALIDMYAKCGLVAKSQEVFDEHLLPNLVSWNALIAGYALLGMADSVFHLFDKMNGESLKPDSATFSHVLNACSNSGLVEIGQMYFEMMIPGYNIMPSLEHHNCMVDLFGRAGCLDNAVAVIKKMPFFANLEGWHTVLGACRKWGNSELGKLAFEHAVSMDENDCSSYICMSNIYSDYDRH